MRLYSSGSTVLTLALLTAALAAPLRAEDRPVGPLYPTVVLRPGETQHVVLSVDGLRIGAGDRTTYAVEFVNDKGERVTGPKGITGAEDRDRMNKLFDQHKQRFVVLTIATDAAAEPGACLVRVRAVPFGGTRNYEAIVQAVVTK